MDDSTPTTPWGRRLVAVALVAIAARGLYLLEMAGDPVASVPLGDEALHVAWAERIADEGFGAGDGTGQGLYHAPGYAWFLALMGAVGVAGRGVLAVQALLGAAVAVLVADSARRLLDDRRVGLVAGLGYALFAPALFHEGTLHKTALAQVFAGAALWALVRARESAGARWPCLLFGATVGLGALVQEILVALLPLALTLRSTGGVAARARPAVLALAGFALGSLPMVARNHVADAPPLARTSNMGPNLWIGSGAGADGHYRELVAGRGQTGTEEEDARRIAEAGAGHRLTPAEISAWWRDRALSDMAAAPLGTAGLVATKLARCGAATEWTDSRSYAVHRRRSVTLGVLGVPFQMAAVVALALAGAVRLRRRGAATQPPLAPTLGAALLYASALSLFFVFGRLRLAIVPLLLPLAADAAVALFDDLRARRRPGAWALVAAALLPLLLLPDERDAAPAATTLSNAAAAHLAAGRPEEARALADASLERAPENANIVFHHGALLLQLGDAAAGRRSLERAATLSGAYGFRAHLWLAEAAAARGDLAGVGAELQRASGYRTLIPDELRRAAELCREAGAPAAAAIFEERIEELGGD